MEKKILDATQIVQKIKRIALEIYEHNINEPTIFLAGIDGGGYEIAQQILENLKMIAQVEVVLIKVSLNKEHPYNDKITLDYPAEELLHKVVILIDDVLNTGRTLAYSLVPFFGVHLKKLQVAILVNRGHHSFPISADYVGYALSTSLNEHIKVVLHGKEAGVYLS